MPRLAKKDSELLEAALIGFQLRRDQLEMRIAELRSLVGEIRAAHNAGAGSTYGRRTMSAAARQRIALAQKQRWANYKAKHGGKGPAAKARQRVMSEAGRARIIAATKKRWAAYRKAREAQSK